MTRDESRNAWVNLYLDAAVGLSMRPYADNEVKVSIILRLNSATVDATLQALKEADAGIGRAMVRQMRDARDLLVRIWNDEHPEPKPQPANGQVTTARK